MKNKEEKTIELINQLPQTNSICTYGSGFFTQNDNAKKKDMDLIISVDNPNQWHMENYLKNPYMYKNAGINALLNHSIDETFPNSLGAFFTEFEGENYKLIVVDKRLLYNDLKTWQHFSLPGRFQKPMKIIVDNTDGTLQKLMNDNYENAIKTVLLMRNDLPFSKTTLYEDITDLSYKGDLRTLTHFENSEKTKNIVHGSYDFFEQTYGNSDLYDYLGDYIMRKEDIDNTEIIDTLPKALKNYLLENASYKMLRNNKITTIKINNFLLKRNFHDSIQMALRCHQTVGLEKTLSTIKDKASKGLIKRK
ncbi:MAG: hypothetical protein IKG40_02375 [Bacilli bacterium]|nr:hypothetical protein [Bacilli bacterium]